MTAFDETARPRLARGVRLRLDRISGKTLLLRPEQGFELQGSALEVVKLCTGELTVAGIVDRLTEAYGDVARAVIAEDVHRLLDDLGRRGVMEMERPVTAPGPAPEPDAHPANTDNTDNHSNPLSNPPRPYTLVAELTYRCPLRCAYCSNPVKLNAMGGELGTAAWRRVFGEAAALGVMQVNLTGGEPLLRDDLEDLVSAARQADLYTTLITSGVPSDRDRLARLRDAGLDGVQLSLQDTEASAAVRIAGLDALADKVNVTRWVRELGLPLTLNVVLHRENMSRLPSLIALGEELRADRLELAHVQVLGWALLNRAALLPTAGMVDDARALIAAARARLAGSMEILAVLPDYFSDRPRACMDGWGQRYLIVAPDGRVLPCHAAHTLPGLTFPNVATQSLADIWTSSDAFTRFRGEAWLPAPCRTCDQRTVDFGGCRCQAYHLTGDMTVTDPSCEFSPHHPLVLRARNDAEAATTTATTTIVRDRDIVRLRRPPTVA